MPTTRLTALVLLLSGCPEPGASPTDAGSTTTPGAAPTGELICSNDAPLELQVQGRSTSWFSGSELGWDVEVWVERTPNGGVRYLDSNGFSSTYVQTDPYRHILFDGSCTDLTDTGVWHVDDIGMNIATGYLSFETRSAIGANDASYGEGELDLIEMNGFPCYDVPEYMGIGRCFSTDLCMDVGQYGEAFGTEILLEVHEVEHGFTTDPFAAVAACL